MKEASAKPLPRRPKRHLPSPAGSLIIIMAVPLATCMMIMPVQVNYFSSQAPRDAAPQVERAAALQERQRRSDDSAWRESAPHDPPSRVAFWRSLGGSAAATGSAPVLATPAVRRAASHVPSEPVFPLNPHRPALPARAPPAEHDIS